MLCVCMNMEEGMYENIVEKVHELVGLTMHACCMITPIMFDVYGNGR